ncbi:hypothetical protein MIC448_780003 [Microbacterium sp. C448]|nr:hypothetical protein MIC448_780003 [Microbacterium sp. C448]
MNQVSNRGGAIVADKPLPGRGDQFRETVRHEVVLVGTLFGDHRFYEGAEPITVPVTLGLNEVEKQVGARHLSPPSVEC